MESPVSFSLKEEPASPLWGLELLDEVEGIWDCGELVLDNGQPVVEEDEFWNEQGIAELISKEEVFALELDDIVLEDSLDSETEPIVITKEGYLSLLNSSGFREKPQLDAIGGLFVNSSPSSVEVNSSDNRFVVQSCKIHSCIGVNDICTDPNCAESVCTDSACCQNVCSKIRCNAIEHNYFPFSNMQNVTVPNYLNCLGYDQYPRICGAESATGEINVPPNGILSQMTDHSYEPFGSWLDSGTLYGGQNSTVSVLASYDSPTSGTWSAPESPGEDKAAAFTPSAAEARVNIQASSDLLREFEDVLSRTTGSLTPPDSPKSSNEINALLHPPSIDSLQTLPASNASPNFIVLQDLASPSGAGEAELDQLMAETLQKNPPNGLLQSIGQPQISKDGLIMDKSSPGHPWDSPSNSSSSDSGYDDPDWCPSKSDGSPGSVEIVQSESGYKKLRLTSTEERRLRKKEQNKNAATRYRMRKKMEMEEIIGEEKELVDRNDNLKSEVVEIAREIRYLKSLMGELFRAKGLISSK